MDASAARHGGQVHLAARQLGRPVSQILDFSASINPLGPPDSVRQALIAALDDIRYYPDATQAAAKAAVARELGVSPTAVLMGNGATELIDMVIRYHEPRRVWIMDPSFSEYRAACRRSRVVVASVRLNPPGFLPDWDQLLDQVQAGDLVVWNNPHNPSGQCSLRPAFHAALHQLGERGVAVLVDEAFIDFLPDQSAATAVPEALRPGSQVIVVRSLTKFLAVPGLRLGYAVANPEWVERVEQLSDRWSVSHLAQQAAVAGLADLAFRHATATWLLEAQSQVERLWPDTDHYQRWPTAVNFFLVRWNDASQAERVRQLLFHDHHLLVRSCADFVGLSAADWRVALRAPADNIALSAAVVTALGEGGAR